MKTQRQKKVKLRKLARRRNTSRKALLQLAKTEDDAKRSAKRKSKVEGKRGAAASTKKKGRKPVVFDHEELKLVHQGLVDVATSCGESVSPLALFSIAMTALMNDPHRSKLPYLHVIVAACIPKIRDAVVLLRLSAFQALISRTVSENVDKLVVVKAMKTAQSIALHCPPSPAIVSFLKALEPSKLNSVAMPAYLGLVSKWLCRAVEHNSDFVMANLSDWVEFMSSCFADTKPPVAAAARKQMISLFEKVAKSRIIVHYTSHWNGTMGVLCQIFKAHSREYWSYGADVVAALFSHFEFLKRQRSVFSGDNSAVSIAFGAAFPKGLLLLRVMDKLRALEDAELSPHVERAIVAIGRCMTVQSFLEVLPFDPHAQVPPPSAEALTPAQRRARWLAGDDEDFEPVADPEATLEEAWGRSYLTRCLARISSCDSLPFCCEYFVSRIEDCRERARTHKSNNEHVAASQWIVLEQQYWRIIAGFCRYPKLVTVDSFKTIAKGIVSELHNPLHLPHCCAALISLCHGYAALANAAVDEDESDKENEDVLSLCDDDDAKRDPCGYYQITPQEAQRVCGILAKFSINIMPKLCNAVETNLSSSALLEAITAYSKVCSAQVMNTVLSGILQIGADLVPAEDETEEAATERAANLTTAKRRMVLDIAMSVVGQLPVEHLHAVFTTIVSPVLSDSVISSANPIIQKKCLKILLRMFECRLRDILPILPQILTALAQSQSSTTPAGVKMRLRCVTWALDAYKMFDPSMLPTLMHHAVGEIVLYAKHASAAVRAMAMDLLEKMYRYYESCGKSSSELLHLVLAGLAGKSPMLVSCTIVCVAKLFWIGHGSYDRTEVEAIARMCIQLLEHVVSEVRSSAAVFCRMMLKLAKRSSVIGSVMSAVLPDILRAIAVVTSQPRQTSSSRRLMRALLEKVIKRFGEEAIESQFPSASKRYFHYVAKMLRRTARLKQRERDEKQGKGGDPRDAFTKMFIGAPDCDDALDLLGDDAAKMFVPNAPHGGGGDADSDADGVDDNLSIASADGKLRIVTKETKRKEEMAKQRRELADRLTARDRLLGPSLTARELRQPETMKRKRDDVVDYENEEVIARFGGDAAATMAQRLPSAITMARRQSLMEAREAKRRRIEKGIIFGDQFAAKAGALGDAKKGGVEPYAYVPLDRRYLNKRYSRQGESRLKLVAHKGVKGAKAKRALLRSKSDR